MYIDAVCKGIDDIPTVDEETRRLMLERYEEVGLEQLCKELKLLDPEYYNLVDHKNPKRVIHALEICYMTGKPYSSFRPTNPRHVRSTSLKSDKTGTGRTIRSINRRVDQMITDG